MDSSMKSAFHGKLSPRQVIGHEIQMLRRQARLSSIKRLLALVVALALLIFFVTFYQTVEVSYLDLIDSSVPGAQSLSVGDTLETIISGLSSSEFDSEDRSCDNLSGWVEAWISSGIMPKCSLAHRNKVEVLFTYIRI